MEDPTFQVQNIWDSVLDFETNSLSRRSTRRKRLMYKSNKGEQKTTSTF